MKTIRFLNTLLMQLLLACLVNTNITAQTETKLVASDGAEGDNFGHRCAISGDFIIVGAPYNDNEKGSDAGAAYIFKRDGNDWNELQKLVGSSIHDTSLFGYSVDIDGDYAIVGACWTDQDGEKSGSAYIYKYDAPVWEEQAILTANDAFKADVFGIAASISGDYAIISAIFDDDCGTTTGSSYIFKRLETTWIEQDKLVPDDCAAEDRFGTVVEIEGDYALVTSQYDDNEMGHDAGSVYIYKRDGSNWLEQDKLIPADSAGNVGYGLGSMYEDHIVIGAFSDDEFLPNAGLAYIYMRYGDHWIEVDRLCPDELKEGDQFGSYCSIFDDRIVISANNDDDVAPDAGACYIFRWDGLEWGQEMKITASDGDTLDKFGTQMDLDDRYLLAASRYNDELGENAGAVYVYQLEPSVEQTANYNMSFVSFRSHPNPFSRETTIEYELRENSHVRLYAINILGQIVKTFADEYQPAGLHYFQWDGISDGGSAIPAGQYFYQIVIDNKVETIKTICIN